MNELVSIVIPVYNAENFIEESIESCLRQDYSNIEIIVVNDGSIDNTTNVLKKYDNIYNVKIIEYENNRGKVYAINKGIEQCQGKYIAIHAADDVCYENRVTLELNLIKSTNAKLVYADCTIVDEELRIIQDSGFSRKVEEPIFEKLLFNNFISGGTILIDGSLRESIFPIPDELKFEDWWIALMCSFYGGVEYLNIPVIKYRQHGNNDCGILNHSRNDKVNNGIKNYKRHINYYKCIRKFINENVYDVKTRKKYNEIIEANVVYKTNLINNRISFIDLVKNFWKYRGVIIMYKKFGIKLILSNILGRYTLRLSLNK